MNQITEDGLPRSRLGHTWKQIDGSNVSFTCSTCGITGYLPAKESEAGIKTSDDCDHYVIECVLRD